MSTAFNFAKVVLVELTGWSLVVLGIIAMPLPGPGTLILFAGLVVLSTRYEWARKVRKRARKWVDRTTCESVATPLRILVSTVSALSLIAVGVILYLDPTLPAWSWLDFGPVEPSSPIPGAGLRTGLPVGVSGLVALGLVIYGYLKYGPGTDFHNEYFKSENG